MEEQPEKGVKSENENIDQVIEKALKLLQSNGRKNLSQIEKGCISDLPINDGEKVGGQNEVQSNLHKLGEGDMSPERKFWFFLAKSNLDNESSIR